jgi:hypothetical protein
MKISKNEILDIRKEYPRHFSKILKDNYNENILEIIQYCIDNNILYNTLSQAIYHYIYNISETPKCITCNKPISKFGVNGKWGYPLYCSIKCSANDPVIKLQKAEKNKQNNRKFSIQNKVKLNDIIKDKNFNLISRDELSYKLKKYIDIDKMQPQNINHYLMKHDPDILRSIYYYYDVIKYKAGEVLYLSFHNMPERPVCRYCNINKLKYISFRFGYSRTCTAGKCKQSLINEEMDIKLKTPLVKNELLDINDLKNIINQYNKNIDSHTLCISIKSDNIIVYKNILYRTSYLPDNCKFSERIYHIINDYTDIQFCKTCNKPLLYFSITKGYNGCRDCGYYISQPEKEMCMFIELNSINIIKNSRSIISPKELDIYIPSKNIAIEYDGIFWHNTSNMNDKNYHLNKTNACKAKGIQLLHVFSNEWEQKQDIVKSIILSKLGIYKNRIYARKCEVREVSEKNIKKQFLQDNHLQGNCNSRIDIGLFYNNELVSLMCFGMRQITRGAINMELLRYSVKNNTQIVGGASKLLKYFENNNKNCKELISYADLRYSNGSLYETLGFKLDHISKPNYWYIIGGELKHRVNYQKHKLSKILKIYEESLTEWENMLNNGYDRIWDCGNLVYKKTYLIDK